MAQYPDGAIQTREELLAFTEGENGIIYLVRNGSTWGKSKDSDIEEIKFSRGAKLRHVKGIGDFFHGQAEHKFMHSFSLSDVNIDEMNVYNNHFTFIDKEKAEAYLALAKKGWHKHQLSTG